MEPVLDYILQYYSQYSGGIVWIIGDQHEEVVKVQVTSILRSKVTKTFKVIPCIESILWLIRIPA